METNEKNSTSVSITFDTWKSLMKLKEKPSESFDDLINRLITEADYENETLKHEYAEQQLTDCLIKQKRDAEDE